MGKYNIAVASATNFSCVGCTDFADYLTKVGIDTFKADGTSCEASADGALVALDSLLTMYNATSDTQSTLETNFNTMYKKTVSGTTSAFFKTICAEQFSTDAWIGKVTLPYMVGSNSTSINLVLPGTTPSFTKCIKTLYSNSTTYQYEIKRTADSLIIGDSTYTKNNFAQGVIPLRLLVCVQASGGRGGDADGVSQSGCGGGGGGFVSAIIDMSTYPNWSLNVAQTTTGDITMRHSSATPKNKTSIGLFALGGSDGGTAANNQGGGGPASVTNSPACCWSLGTRAGASGGSTGSGGGSTAALTLYTMSTMRAAYNGTSKTYSAKSGGTTDGFGGGGGASASHNGANAEKAGQSGAGGGGASYYLFTYKTGSNGGAGYISVYY